jgi:hypothetical protein
MAMAARPLDPNLPASHPVAVLESASAVLRDAVSQLGGAVEVDAADAAAFAAALADREEAIRSLGRALGPRPPRLIVQRLEQVLVDDGAILTALEAHLDGVRAELAALGHRRAAAAAYESAGPARRR